ncbi:MAG: phosphomethylpyrimidine synthase ThiC, partial [Planctomycetota bacterium]|nr:phosphomethylpyrimidine synthase ThiC [Planctomycetota bacterium]
MTLLEKMRAGLDDERLARVARAENLPADLLRRRLADGTAVIPWADGHGLAKPMAVGRGCRVKVNANIGASPDISTLEEELEKLRVAVDAGADAVMDLSIGGDLREIRRRVRAACPVSLGSVPVYEAAFACSA